MTADYKLTYFNGRGRAELVRWIFVQTETAYWDCRIERSEWMNIKDDSPFFQLPMLDVDGQTFSQSIAIARYAAQQLGLNGSTPEEAAKADMIVNCCEDIANGMGPIFFEKDEEKKIELKTKYEEKIRDQIVRLEKLLTKSQGTDGWFIGNQLTWADFAVVLYLSDWIEPINVTPDWSLYPNLDTHRKKVLALPRISAWLKKRPVTVL